MTRKTRSYFYLGLCIISWALIPVVSKKMLIELDNLQILFYSTIFSVLSMICILIYQNKFSLFKKYSSFDYLNMAWLGFLGTYLYYILLYGAFALTSASEGFILAYTWPILVLVLAFILLKERVTIKKIISILISFMGIWVIVSKGNLSSLNFSSLNGDLLALAGAFVFALFSVLGKKSKYDQVISVFIYFLTALFLLVPTIFLFSSLKLPSLEIWPWIVLNGLLVNGISYVFWFKALEYGDTSVLTNTLYLTPFTSLLFITLFLGEPILISSVIGLLIVVTGIFLQSMRFKKN